MTKLLLRLFVRDGDVRNAAVRGRCGLLSSVVGICCNAVLFALKFLIGTLSGSVSITADSVNNLSDAGSSIVTLVGFKVSARPADEGHPFGHARAEYIGGLIVSFMILLLGVEFFRTSLQRVLHPEPLSISPFALLALGLSILLKVWLCVFNRRIGRLIGSAAILAMAQDSLNDVVTTSAVLLAGIVGKLTGWTLDGWMGLVVAVFIAISGLQVARDTVGPLLGESPPQALVEAIEQKVRTTPGVLGLHDLMVHSYGPGRWFASLHAEVDAGEDILRSHDLIDNIERDVLADLGVHLVIHLDPLVTGDPLVDELRAFVEGCVRELDPALSMHDFRLVRGKTHSNLIFDVTVPPGLKLSDAVLTASLEEKIRRRDSTYFSVVTVDRSYVSSNNNRPKID